MLPKQTLLVERTFLLVGSLAFVALTTIAAAALQALIEGMSADTVVRALVVGKVAPLFYPTMMVCLGCLWVVLYMRLGREN